MPHKPFTPTCPTCNYDLIGLFNQGSSATCPECNTSSTYTQATYRKPPTPTIKIALVWVFAIPSAASLIAWAWLYIGTRLSGITFVYLGSLFLFLYLPIFTLVLLVQEWRSRRKSQTHRVRPSAILIIVACLAISGTCLWLSFSDWMEAFANV